MHSRKKMRMQRRIQVGRETQFCKTFENHTAIPNNDCIHLIFPLTSSMPTLSADMEWSASLCGRDLLRVFLRGICSHVLLRYLVCPYGKFYFAQYAKINNKNTIYINSVLLFYNTHEQYFYYFFNIIKNNKILFMCVVFYYLFVHIVYSKNCLY